MSRSSPQSGRDEEPQTVHERLDDLESDLQAEREARREPEVENEHLRELSEDLESLVEVRAESIDEANATDVWIAGVPIGTIVDGANKRAKGATSAVDELREDLEDDVVDLEERVTVVEATVDTDSRRSRTRSSRGRIRSCGSSPS